VGKEFFLKEETLLDQAGQEVSLVTSMDIKVQNVPRGISALPTDYYCIVAMLHRVL